MSSLAPRRESLDPPKVSRKASRERSVSAQATTPDGPVLDGSVRRQAGFRPGLVFGKDLSAVGREWGVVHEAGLSERELQRRSVLPAVVVRCVDYCEWCRDRADNSNHMGTQRRGHVSY